MHHPALKFIDKRLTPGTWLTESGFVLIVDSRHKHCGSLWKISLTKGSHFCMDAAVLRVYEFRIVAIDIRAGRQNSTVFNH
jgi:hypothetical protein